MGRVANKKQTNKRWLKITLLVIAVFVIGIGAYTYSIYHNAKTTVDGQMHEPVQAIDTGLAKSKIKKKKPLHILLLGIDAHEGENGRSDALMVLTLDPKGDRMQLVSIPRDTRVPIVGKGIDDKINHAYAFGGNEMSVATVESLLDLELDYYVSINMDGFHKLVDQLDGITVNNDMKWQDGNDTFDFGPIEMDGDKTMGFVRMRKQDPSGDFGRTKRQRQVIQGMVDKGASVGSITKINGVIDILGNNMATNMDFDDMKKLFSDYRDTRNKFVDYQMTGEGSNIGGTYYLIVSEEEINKVQTMIKEFGT